MRRDRGQPALPPPGLQLWAVGLPVAPASIPELSLTATVSRLLPEPFVLQESGQRPW